VGAGYRCEVGDCINIEVERVEDQAITDNRTRAFRARFSIMNSDRKFETAIRAAKNLLWRNLPPTHNLPDAATVTRVRELVHSASIQSALQRSSDTFRTFALRAVEHVVADQSQTDRQIINRLWDILDDPHLNQAMGSRRTRA
jgi:hypothetical protein